MTQFRVQQLDAAGAATDTRLIEADDILEAMRIEGIEGEEYHANPGFGAEALGGNIHIQELDNYGNVVPARP